MTTNARGEKWSEWIEWKGGKCPIPDDIAYEIKERNGAISTGECDASLRGTMWQHTKTYDEYDIIAYRYKIEEPSGISEADEEECIQLAYERMNEESVPTSIKQLRYQDAKGEDWIDEFARTSSVDEFRGAMKFTIGKYNRRAGKKDELIKEIEKMRDYCDRWIKYERSL